MKAIIISSCCLVLGSVAGYIGGVHHLRNGVAAYIVRRPMILTLEAKNREPGGVLIVGDSIVELSGIDRLCGARLFNGGVSSAKLSEVAQLAVALANELRPARIFLQIGTNDASRSGPSSPSEWGSRYATLVNALGPKRVVIVPSPTIDETKHRVDNLFSEKTLTSLNAQLPAIARQTGATLLPRPRVATIDGVHFAPEAVASWQRSLERGCEMKPI